MKLSLGSFLYEIVFNEKCPICNKKSYWKVSPFCESCWSSIKPLNLNLFIKEEFSNEFWKYVDSLSCFAAYDGILKEAINIFKYQKIKRVGKLLGKLLVDISPKELDILVPVPLHPKKLKTREFNQSAILAKEISNYRRIPLSLTILKKIKDNPPQVSLKASERKLNVKDVYSVSRDIKNLKIGLVDDVITTGATLAECAKVLKRAGAKEVHAITVAKTV
ncbi:MAG: ComF family protein [Thermodesulfovibrionaceae bacterium]